METGVVSSENISNLLRGISQRRRQGTLEINYPDTKFQIFFVQGKVVDLAQQGVSKVSEIIQCLKDAGYLDPSLNVSAQSYTELFKNLEAQQVAVQQDLFSLVVKHRILDRFYALDMSHGAYYTFDVQMIEYDRDFCPSISVGQLLLDLVAMNTDAPRFNSLFGEDVIVVRSDVGSSALSEEEQVLMHHIEDGIRIADLRRRSLLSRYHFQEALLALHERGLIGTRRDSNGVHNGKNIEAENLLPNLDEMIDVAFAGDFVEVQSETMPVRETIENKPSIVGQSSGQTAGLSNNISTPMEVKRVVRSMGVTSRLHLLSAKALQGTLIPRILCWLIIIAASCLPWITWANVFDGFR